MIHCFPLSHIDRNIWSCDGAGSAPDQQKVATQWSRCLQPVAHPCPVQARPPAASARSAAAMLAAALSLSTPRSASAEANRSRSLATSDSARRTLITSHPLSSTPGDQSVVKVTPLATMSCKESNRGCELKPQTEASMQQINHPHSARSRNAGACDTWVSNNATERALFPSACAPSHPVALLVFCPPVLRDRSCPELDAVVQRPPVKTVAVPRDLMLEIGQLISLDQLGRREVGRHAKQAPARQIGSGDHEQDLMGADDRNSPNQVII